MKLIICIVLLKISLFANNVMLPEATVAVVDGNAISENQLDREVAKLLPQTFYHAKLNDKKLAKLKKTALKSLIEETLIYNYALSKNITVTDDELEEMLEKLEEAYGSKKVLMQALKNSKFTTEEFKQAVKRGIVLEKFNESEIEYKVTDKELQEYYEKNKFKFKEPDKIKVRLIYVRNDPTDPDGKAKAKAKIEEAQSKLEEGEDFAFIAQEYSNDNSRVMGGDLGFIHKGRLDINVEEIAFAMDVNTTSEIIEKDIGYYIVRVEKKQESKQLPFDKIKDGLKKDLKKKEEKKRKSELLEALMSKAVIIK